MASFWFWFFLSIVSIVVGVVSSILTYGAIAYISDKFKYKRGIPKEKKEVSKWIRENKDKIDFEEKPQVDERRELIENARRNAEFREFEGLRKLEIESRGKDAIRIPQREDDVGRPDQFPDSTNRDIERSSKGIKLD